MAKTRVKIYELKSRVRDKCVEEGSHVNVKNTKMKHAKVRMLVGECTTFASK